MNLNPSENQSMIRDMARKFAEKHIRPYVMEWDEAQHFPIDLFKKMGEQGMLGVLVPEAYGGAGLGYHEYVSVIDEIAQVCGSIGLSTAAHNSLCTGHMLQFCNEEQNYNATIMLISAGVNLNIARDEDSKAWPYFRFSVGMGNYSSERKFMNDELVFSSTSGNCLQNGLGFGYAFKIGNDFGLRLGTEFIVNYTDAWDGYDNDTGTDILLRSGLKFTYTFPSKNAKYQRAVTPVKS